MLKYSLVILLILLNKEIPIFLTPTKITSKFGIISKIDLNTMPMFDSIYKLTIVDFLVEVIENTLILSILLSILAEVDAILIFFYNRMLYSNR